LKEEPREEFDACLVRVLAAGGTVGSAISETGRGCGEGKRGS
jgi:hypothetical protein